MRDLASSPVFRNAEVMLAALEARQAAPEFAVKEAELVAAIADAKFDAPIFSDLDFPYYALSAYQHEQLSLAQFTSIILNWSALADYPDEHRQNVRFYQLKPKDVNSRRMLTKFLTLQSFHGIDDTFDKENLDAIMVALLNGDVPASERSFMTFTIDSKEKAAAMFNRLRELDFKLFIPIRQPDGRLLVIVPSFTIIQTVLDQLAPDKKRQLIPRFGEDDADSVATMHAKGEHPFGMSFPCEGFEHDEADGFQCGRLGFSIHDVYHVSLLLFTSSPAAINRLIELARSLQISLENESQKEQVQSLMEVLIDNEFRQRFAGNTLQKIRDKRAGDTPDDLEMQVYFALNQSMRPLIQETQVYKMAEECLAEAQKKMDEAQRKIILTKMQTDFPEVPNLALGRLFLQTVYQDMFSQSEAWQAMGFNLAKFVTLMHPQNPAYKQALARYENDKKPFFFSDPEQKLLTNTFHLGRQQCREVFGTVIQECSDEACAWLQQYRALLNKLAQSVMSNDLASLKALIADETLKHYIDDLNLLLVTGPSLIDMAIEHNHVAIVAPLVAAGARVDGSQLIKCAKAGKAKMLACLLELGACPTYKDEQGLTAIAYCLKHDVADCLHVLLRRVSLSIGHLAYLTKVKKIEIQAACAPLLKRYQAFKAKLDDIRYDFEVSQTASMKQLVADNHEDRFPYTVCAGHYRSIEDVKYPNQHEALDSISERPLICHVRDVSLWKLLHKHVPLDIKCRYYDDNTLSHLLFPNTRFAIPKSWSIEIAKVRFLLKHGADIYATNKYGKNAITLALETRSFNVIDLFEEQLGAINWESIQRSLIRLVSTSIGKNQWTAETIYLVKYLIKKGVNFNRRTYTREALDFMAWQTRDDLVSLWQLLRGYPIVEYSFLSSEAVGSVNAPLDLRLFCIRHGADVNQLDYQGKPELNTAVERGWFDYAVELLSLGANPNLTDADDNSALHMAAKDGRVAFIELLMSYGAQSFENSEGLTPAAYGIVHDQLAAAAQLNGGDLRSTLPLLKENSELQALVTSLVDDAAMQAASTQLASALNKGHPTRELLSTDTVPQLALLAMTLGQINTQQFYTTLIQWRYFHAYGEHMQNVQVHVCDRNDTGAWQHLLPFLTQEHLTNQLGQTAWTASLNTFPHEALVAIFKKMSDPTIPASERLFISFDIDPRLVKLPASWGSYRPKQLLAPQKIADTSLYRVIIPSITLLQTITASIDASESLVPVMQMLSQGEKASALCNHAYPLILTYPSGESVADSQKSVGHLFANLETIHKKQLSPIKPMIKQVLPVLTAAGISQEDIEAIFFNFELRSLRSDMTSVKCWHANTQHYQYSAEEQLMILLTECVLMNTVYEKMLAEQRSQVVLMALAKLFGVDETAKLERKKVDAHRIISVLVRHFNKHEPDGFKMNTFLDLALPARYENSEGLISDHVASPVLHMAKVEYTRYVSAALVKDSFVACGQIIFATMNALAEASDCDFAFESLYQRNTTQLSSAVETRNIAALTKLLTSNRFKRIVINPLQVPVQGMPIIHYMIENQCIDLLNVFISSDYPLLPEHLTYAVKQQHTAMVKFMLDQGLSPFVLDEKGLTPVAYCLERGDTETLYLFLQRIVIGINYLHHLKKKEVAVHPKCLQIMHDYYGFIKELQAMMNNYGMVDDIRVSKIIQLSAYNDHRFNLNIFLDAAQEKDYSDYPFPDSKLEEPLLCRLHASEVRTLTDRCSVNFHLQTSNGKNLAHYMLTTIGNLAKFSPSFSGVIGFSNACSNATETLMEFIGMGVSPAEEDNNGYSAITQANNLEDKTLYRQLKAKAGSSLAPSLQNVLFQIMLNKNTWAADDIKRFKAIITAGYDLNKPVLIEEKEEGINMPAFSMWGVSTAKYAIRTVWSRLRGRPIYGSVPLKICEIAIYTTLDAPLDIRQFCIEQGANPNELSFDGQTELAIAIKREWFDYAKQLLAKGADPIMPDSNGVTAKQIAMTMPDRKYIALIDSHLHTHVTALAVKTVKQSWHPSQVVSAKTEFFRREEEQPPIAASSSSSSSSSAYASSSSQLPHR